jgi:hypothetical protein
MKTFNDCTFALPMSVSILWANSSRSERAKIELSVREVNEKRRLPQKVDFPTF